MRIVLTATLIGASLATLDVAEASEFWARVHLDAHRVNCWPEPFNHDDRNLVRNPLVAMTNRGWQLQNTLSDHFFQEDDQTLTRAGEYKLRWILSQAPHRRTIHVVRSLDSYGTSERIASVRDYVTSILQTDAVEPEILATDIAPAGGSGDYFDQVDRQLKASVPAPRLPGRTGIIGAGG